MRRALMIMFLLMVFSGTPGSSVLALQQTAYVLAITDDRLIRLPLSWAIEPGRRRRHHVRTAASLRLVRAGRGRCA